MDFEDLLQPEVAVGAAVAAAIFSPRVRGLLRRGAVYGLAGALVAGDAVTTAAKGATHAARQAGTAVGASVSTAASTVKNAPSETTDHTVQRVPVTDTGTNSNDPGGSRLAGTETATAADTIADEER